LVRGDTFLVLDLGIDIVDGIARLDVKGNGKNQNEGSRYKSMVEVEGHHVLFCAFTFAAIQKTSMFKKYSKNTCYFWSRQIERRIISEKKGVRSSYII
jgi:hypothetical protein